MGRLHPQARPLPPHGGKDVAAPHPAPDDREEILQPHRGIHRGDHRGAEGGLQAIGQDEGQDLRFNEPPGRIHHQDPVPVAVEGQAELSSLAPHRAGELPQVLGAGIRRTPIEILGNPRTELEGLRSQAVESGAGERGGGPPAGVQDDTESTSREGVDPLQVALPHREGRPAVPPRGDSGGG